MMIMFRSFADFMGFNWAPEVAMVVDGEKITYYQLLKERKERQRKHLQDVLECENPNWYYGHIWTFYNPGFIYSGWHLYVRTLKNRWWIGKRDCDDFVLKIMAMFPCGFLPIFENFYRWKKSFADEYHRHGKQRNKQGMVVVRIKVGLFGDLIEIAKVNN